MSYITCKISNLFNLCENNKLQKIIIFCKFKGKYRNASNIKNYLAQNPTVGFVIFHQFQVYTVN